MRLKKRRIEPSIMATISKEREEAFYNRSLERALQIITAFSTERQRLTLGQLSESLTLPKATVFRLCATLVKCGFLRQDQERKEYCLGVKLLELGNIVASSFSLGRAASPHVARLHARVGKTVFLAVLDEGELLYIDKREDPGAAIVFTSNVGRRRPPYWGMLGFAVMAYLPQDEVESLLAKTPLTAATKKTPANKEELEALLKKVREQGYAIEDGLFIDGVAGVGAPVRDFTGKVVAAIGVGFFSSLVGPRELKKIARATVSAAEAISLEAGYRGNA